MTDNLETLGIHESWKQLRSHLESSIVQEEHDSKTVCKACKSTNIQLLQLESVCCDCGVVVPDILLDSQPQFEEPIESRHTTNRTCVNSRLVKMQTWYMWSNEEKNNYKLKQYTKELCYRLNIQEGMMNNICDTVVHVMNVIKKYEGTKRARVKDGIILTCIQYVFSTAKSQMSALELAKKLNLEVKYITKAEKIIIELTNSGKLNLSKTQIHEFKTPYHCVKEVIDQHLINIPLELLSQLQTLIDICKQNDLLLDNTPLSVGVCCLYYILQLHSIEIDLKVFSNLFGLSVMTILKTFNKLQDSEKIRIVNSLKE